MMYVVYQTPPLDITWGLARDTRESLIDSGPWNDTDNPALYYYLLDFEEGWSGPLAPEPGKDPNIIRWRGDHCAGIPESLADIPAVYRHKADLYASGRVTAERTAACGRTPPVRRSVLNQTDQL